MIEFSASGTGAVTLIRECTIILGFYSYPPNCNFELFCLPREKQFVRRQEQYIFLADKKNFPLQWPYRQEGSVSAATAKALRGNSYCDQKLVRFGNHNNEGFKLPWNDLLERKKIVFLSRNVYSHFATMIKRNFLNVGIFC